MSLMLPSVGSSPRCSVPQQRAGRFCDPLLLVHSRQHRCGAWSSVLPKQRDTKLRAVIIDEDDLLQAPDRLKWYETKFCADEMPDWNVGNFLYSEQLSPDVRNIVVECEISREKIPVRNAYKFLGQKACIRINNGVENQVTVASAPFSHELNKSALFKVRGDLFANEIKTVKEPEAIMAQLHLMVTEKGAPDVYRLEEGDKLEVGPFLGTGMDVRSSPIQGVYRYPTVLLLVSGEGVGTARAIIESTNDHALNIGFRKSVRMYYKAPNEMSFCYRGLFDEWRQRGVEVVTTTRSFQDAFDGDAEFAYDPDTTAAIILTGGDVEADEEARKMCAEAEVTTILRDADAQAPTIFLSSTPKNFLRWKNISNL